MYEYICYSFKYVLFEIIEGGYVVLLYNVNLFCFNVRWMMILGLVVKFFEIRILSYMMFI